MKTLQCLVCLCACLVATLTGAPSASAYDFDFTRVCRNEATRASCCADLRDCCRRTCEVMITRWPEPDRRECRRQCERANERCLQRPAPATPEGLASMPKPILQYDGWEQRQVDSPDGLVTFYRYRFSVANRAHFDPRLFAPAPGLTPCGTEAKGNPRARIDFFENTFGGPQLSTFCALDSSDDLGALWFTVPTRLRQPRLVFIEIVDRIGTEKVRSNSVEVVRRTAPIHRPPIGPRPPVGNVE